MTNCENCGYDPSTTLCPDCGYLPAGENGSHDPERSRCWTCEFPNEPKQGIEVAGYVMKGGQFCDGDKRIHALPGNHPDANPSSQAEANRIMQKHGIDRATGRWKDEKKQEAAMAVSKKLPNKPKKETTKRVR